MESQANTDQKQSTSVSRIGIIAKYELTRLFNTKRGWMALTAFALVWYFILRYPINYAATYVREPDFEIALQKIFGLFGVETLLDWPIPELSIYWVTSLILFPLFALLITADQISSDKARGTLRFILLRSTRFELFIGRYLGQVLILTILIFATLTASSAMAIYRDSSLAMSTLPDFGFVVFHLVFVLLPVVAITALTSVVCQSARSATFLAIIGISGSFILVGIATYYFPQLAFIDDYMPGAQIRELATSSGLDSLNNLVLPIGQTITILAIAMYLFKRRAL